ncbi:GNAT family N-acetyltransferase [Salinimonas sp. HHU 13199]|uniref:GNAT family N-acetyltransferase n=1 Tax=Salinimonas profundi TaxID=2729140 RepID=A0ABR8LMV4_9ALTE|nr:GNAT family N-acetyltransferase [Salinimonas profundi]MBD3586620.1 GNAT family N-acetyltransferase [Salinimonas profundi]
MEVRLDTGHAGLTAIRTHWQALEERVKPSVFIRYDWCHTQALMGSDAVLLSVWDGERCMAILPLALRQLSAKVRTRVLTHLCQRFTDYQTLLIDKDADSESVFDAMLHKLASSPFGKYSLYFPYPDNQLSSVLQNQPGCRHCQSWTHTQFRSLGAPVKAKVAREARRRLRKLRETGNISVSINTAFNRDMVSQILDMSAQRHGENALTCNANRQRILDLLEALQSAVHLNYITKEGKLIAAHLGFIHEETLLYYVPVTDENERRFSPGIILLSEIIQHLNDHGLSRIDYLRGEEDYKQDWGNVHETRSGLFLPARFGLNIKQRLLTHIWLKRNP